MIRVIFIPTIHDPLVGRSAGMSPEVVDGVSAYVKRYSSVVEGKLAHQSFDPERTRIYLEATYAPFAEELPHIEKGAEAGFWECQLVLDLLKKGMRYEPAELESLHGGQGRLIDLWPKVGFSKVRAMVAGNERIEKQREVLGKKISNQIGELELARDRTTAMRISQTLQDGETGLVIFGANHNIQRFLDPSIEFYSLQDEIAQEVGTLDEAVKTARLIKEGNFGQPETKN